MRGRGPGRRRAAQDSGREAAAQKTLEVDRGPREKLVLDWRKRQQTRAGVQQAIEEALDRGLPEKYDKKLYDAKCTAVFQHVYEAYRGAGESVYATS